MRSKLIKVLYIVSTLKKSGPTNQLYNLLKYLDRNLFDPIIITLSPEPKETYYKKIESLNILIVSLNLSRIQWFCSGNKLLRKTVHEINPDIMQTQGIRSDSVTLKIFSQYPIVTVLRCYPYLDYPLRYGRIMGTLMAIKHLSVIKKSLNPIGCSKSVAKEISKNRIYPAKFIQNGVDLEIYQPIPSKDKITKRSLLNLPIDKSIFIYTGSLNSRKDVKTLLMAFKIANIDNNFILLIVGNGPEKEKLKTLANDEKSILFIDFILSVLDYLHASDYFVSSSTAEGLPNSVVEAIACGLPPILSDIPPHRELFEKLPEYDYFFPVGNIQEAAKCLTNIIKNDYKKLSENVIKLIETDFNAYTMSLKYEDLYKQILASKSHPDLKILSYGDTTNQ